MTEIQRNTAGQANRPEPYRVPRQRAPTEGREMFRRYLLTAAIAGEWLVWAEFADRAHRDLIRSAPPSRDAVKRATAWAKKTRAEMIESEEGESRRSVELDRAIERIRGWPDRQAEAVKAAGRPCSNEGGPCTAQESAQAEIDKLERYYAMSPEDRAPSVEALVKHRLRDLTEVGDSLGAWRKARAATLTELDTLGLAATVERTDRSIALGDHEADLAGLVRVHLPGRDPQNPRSQLDAMQTAYAERMHRSHGLMPFEGLPRTLRALCGQVRPMSRSWPGDRVVMPGGEPWMDHTHTWLDAEGLPVLTTEPYKFDPLAVVRELADLPLDVEVLPGAWNDGTTLIMFRWDCEATPLPAEHKILVERYDHKTRESVRVYV